MFDIHCSIINDQLRGLFLYSVCLNAEGYLQFIVYPITELIGYWIDREMGLFSFRRMTSMVNDTRIGRRASFTYTIVNAKLETSLFSVLKGLQFTVSLIASHKQKQNVLIW